MNTNREGFKMGLYIQKKEAWLLKNGSFLFAGVGEPTFNYDVTTDKQMIVCLVDNGAFTALGVAFDEREFNVFKRPDTRMKAWFLLDVELIKENTVGWENYL